jgi:hypothetical protein
MRDLDKIRRQLRSKTLNVLERIEQLEDKQEDVSHLDSAIKYLGLFWEECKKESAT